MSDHIFEAFAPRYWEHNLPVIPLRPRNKMPDISGWSAFGSRMPTDLEQQHWLASFPKGNIGLPLGPTSGVCIIDIDTEDAELDAAIRKICGPTPWVRVGKKGAALAYQFEGQKNFKLRGADGGMLCEFLGLGNQVVVPPSIHPDTGEAYTASANLWEVLGDIPHLGEDIEVQLRHALTSAGASLVGGTAHSWHRLSRPLPGTIEPSRFHPWLLQRLDEGKIELGKATQGDRNNTLLRVASKLARHVAAAGEDWGFYAAELTNVAGEIGLEEGEISGTLSSAWRYGSEDPTPWLRIAQEWVYVSGADRFRHLGTGEHLTQQAFRTEFGSINPDPDVSITTFLTRNDYIPKVQNLAFEPKEPFGIFDANGRKWLNTYRPPAIVPVKGDATPFVNFVEYLVPDEAERDHLLKMFAHLVRNPGEKLGHALVLGSREHGIGKSTLIQILFELLGPHNCRKASSEELESQYNAYIEGTLLVLVEEINLGEGGRRTYNKLKDQITSDTTPMRRLYQDARQVRNVASFVFLTNLDRPILLDKEDRRYFVVNSPAKPRDPGFYIAFNEWWRANLGVIRHYLDQVDLVDFNRLAHPPMTEAKAQLIRGSETPLVQELREMLGDRHPPFHVDIVTYQQVAEALHRRLPKATRNAIEDGLREIGAIPLGQHRVGKAASISVRFLGQSDRPSLWAIRNQPFWEKASRQERIEEYLAEEGRLADHPELPSGFAYAPASSLPPVPDCPRRDRELWMLDLLRSLRKREQEQVE